MKVLAPAASQSYLGITGPILSLILLIFFLSLFAYIMYQRIRLLRCGQVDKRLDHLGQRVVRLLLLGFGQWRQPRYFVAGCLHILLFAGFMVLSLRSLQLIGRGFSATLCWPLGCGALQAFYSSLKDYVEVIVLGTCIVAALRRIVWRPARYYDRGKHHGWEGLVILGMIAALMITDMLYEGAAAAHFQHLTLASHPGAVSAAHLLQGLQYPTLVRVELVNYWIHFVLLLTFLCYLPLSKHFHVITALPNVFFMKLQTGSIKPLRWDVDWTEVEHIGVEKFEDFTWKHMLDFYSCTDCGRCTDNCPANAVGRPLSPRMITIKSRDYGYQKQPVFRKPAQLPTFMGEVIQAEELWSCTTCGACEQECPVTIEYIDKIVDMRRFLVDNGEAPKCYEKPLRDLYKKGNPYGLSQQKRADWTQNVPDCQVRILQKQEKTEVLFWVDSCASFDPRNQQIAQAVAQILHHVGVDYGILGAREYDAGNEVRRIGEEGLFYELAEKNIAALESVQFDQLVTTDPHALNTLRNDYPQPFDIIHISQLLWQFYQQGRLKFKALQDDRLYTYHDPCYLGRHNQIYQAPRKILRAIPGLHYREMTRSFSRSFCCGGGGLYLWYEAQEETRMGVKRLQMAQEIGAQVVVTNCPYCMVQLEDAVKTSQLEGQITIMDMSELVAQVLA